MGLTNWVVAGRTWGREKGHETSISQKFPLHNTPQLKCNTACHSHEYEDALPWKTRATYPWLRFLLNFSPVVFLMVLQQRGVLSPDGQLTLQPPGPPLCWFGWAGAAQDMQKSGDPTLVPGSGTVWPAAKARGMNSGKVLAWRRSWGLLESFWRHIKQLGTEGEIKSI